MVRRGQRVVERQGHAVRLFSAPSLGWAIALLLLSLKPPPLLAGEQQYEALSHSVTAALSAAVADRREPQPLWDSLEYKVAWLTAMADKLPLRHKPTYVDRREFLHTVRYEAQRAGLEPELVLALIQVESGFRRYAISSAGARGYMQVMPFWTGLIGNGDAAALFDMMTNIRYGCVILRHYLDRENGNLFMALGRYNGSRGRSEYPNAVFAALERWKFRPPARAPLDEAAR
ncbi:MAG TPA: lytic transglycosylase domain-containing protein [Lautropia sp.]|jgi:soluble lytic murein transglycosylase-like protein|nr:lytic transglycosylase domain-containing protein [Lautropia sp.]